MSDFTIHTIESAPAASAEMLSGVKAKVGFVPNLLGEMAASPAVLGGYLTLGDLLSQTSLSPVAQQVVLLATSVANSCEYCVAAHSAMLAMAKVPREEIEAIRQSRALSDSALEALRVFVTAVVTNRGEVTQPDVQRFIAAGYRREQILEVLLGVAMKTLSNYTNHIADTPLDPQFAAFAWEETAMAR